MIVSPRAPRSGSGRPVRGRAGQGNLAGSMFARESGMSPRSGARPEASSRTGRAAACILALLAAALLPVVKPAHAAAESADVPKWKTQLSTASARRRLDEELAQIVALLPGRYEGIAPAMSNRPGQAATPSPVYHKIVRIDAPRFGRTVFYHQIGREGFEGSPIQQKIYAFDESPARDANRMKAWVIPPGRGLANLEASRDELRALQPQSLMSFPRACDIAWKRVAAGFEANVSSATCEYPSEAFRTNVRPDMTYVLGRESFSLQEAMHRADGSEIFAMPQPIVARRLGPGELASTRP